MQINGGGCELSIESSFHYCKKIASRSTNWDDDSKFTGGSRFDEPQPQKRAQNKPVVQHPARSLNLDMHTIQEAHDAPWISAYDLNKALTWRH